MEYKHWQRISVTFTIVLFILVAICGSYAVVNTLLASDQGYDYITTATGDIVKADSIPAFPVGYAYSVLLALIAWIGADRMKGRTRKPD